MSNCNRALWVLPLAQQVLDLLGWTTRKPGCSRARQSAFPKCPEAEIGAALRRAARQRRAAKTRRAELAEVLMSISGRPPAGSSWHQAPKQGGTAWGFVQLIRLHRSSSSPEHCCLDEPNISEGS